MLRRSLTILPFVALVLTLLLAAPAWADTTLSVDKSDSPTMVRVGEQLTYFIDITNTGATETAENVRLDDFLPDNATFVSAEVIAGGGSCTEPDVGARGGTVRCNLGDIATGATETETVRIRVKPTVEAGEAGFVDNTATAEGSNTNSPTDRERTIVEGSRVTVEKDDFPDPADVGESLLYRLRVTNESGLSRDLRVVDELPDNVDFRSVDISGDFADASCSESSNVVRCSIDGLADGDTATIRIFVEPLEDGTITNEAQVFYQNDRFTPIADARERTTVEARDDDNDNGGGGGGSGGGTTNTLDCDDFSSQADAQAELDSDTSDPHELDPDNDDIACEDFTYTVAVAQDPADTTDPTSSDSPETTTADAEAQTADGVNSEADAFRCDFFLHVVRDEQGGVRDQYRDDELIVRRFEQCLSEDVLTGTIPNRRLPGTGGPALLGLAALGLASLVAGASVLRAGTRRRR